jgi:Leucine-rich repeat (LRR) protein
LNLSDNALKTLPVDFGSLKVGENLDCQGLGCCRTVPNLGCRLPESFGNLTVVGNLNMYGSVLQLPLPSFGSLNIGGDFKFCSIYTAGGDSTKIGVPPEFSGSFLVGGELGLSCNCIEELPETFSLIKVGSLDLQMNNLKSLPQSFGQLGKLQGFNLSYNKGPLVLPESFSQLEISQDCNLHCAGLEKLPESFGELKVGGKLALSDNQLTHLPESFGRLRISKDLDLQNNKLVSLPSSFGELKVNGNLNMYSTMLEQLPDSFGNLKVGGNLYLGIKGYKFALPASMSSLQVNGQFCLSVAFKEEEQANQLAVESLFDESVYQVSRRVGYCCWDWNVKRK